MKGQVDKKRRDVNLEVEDLVFVKLQPYRQQSMALRKKQKLGMGWYFGLFPIIAKVVTIFHASQLKLHKGGNTEQYIPMPLTTTELGSILQPNISSLN